MGSRNRSAAAFAGLTKKERIDREWEAAIPAGWGTKRHGFDKQERADKGMHSGERQMLYEIIDDDEHIHCLVGGNYRADADRFHKHSGVAVATMKRVIFLDKGLLGSTETADIAYRNIESVTQSTGMMFGGVHIAGRGVSSYRVDEVKPKASAKIFADTVRRLVEKWQAPAPATVSQQSDADELAKWAKLLRDGVVTQAEYDHKKRQLLGT